MQEFKITALIAAAKNNLVAKSQFHLSFSYLLLLKPHPSVAVWESGSQPVGGFLNLHRPSFPEQADSGRSHVKLSLVTSLSLIAGSICLAIVEANCHSNGLTLSPTHNN